MSADSIDQVFEKAISTIHTLSSLKGYNSLPRPPAHVRIELYAFFKQATEGDAQTALTRPDDDSNDADRGVALKKWNAWHTKHGMAQIEAKKQYIQLLISTMRSYAMGTIAARELLGDLEFLWWQVADGGGEVIEDNSSMILALQDDIPDSKSLHLRREIYETLSALNEKKLHLSKHSRAGHGKDLKKDITRLSRLKKQVYWLASLIAKYAYFLLKKLLYNAVFLLLLFEAANHFQISPPQLANTSFSLSNFRKACEFLWNSAMRGTWTAFKSIYDCSSIRTIAT
ncbi:LAMI_0D11386g1_1 [Lachancea mirantina]|uniref:LAMI_0D11386g1_1 n=1 Tax=Lachancea mirantina TaxID=1230905 RepID=A0A1G4JEX4_9SACH|nr:LAMI_0D11386g1_1 [Lachancea mirantina]